MQCDQQVKREGKMDGQSVATFLFGVVAGIGADFVKDYLVRRGKDYILRRAKAHYDKTKIPLPDAYFRCFRFGNFEIPAMPVIGSPETPFHPDEVTIHLKPDVKSFPVELQAARQYLIEELQRRYGQKNLGEGDLSPRIDKIEQGPELPGDKR